ncbi:MAG: hypothetical protein FJ317_00820 [SAR202 cluster bacterium]|nr:hypothetical protein [SAR202 cluster bacterium]
MNYDLVRILLLDVLQTTAQKLDPGQSTQLNSLWRGVEDLAKARKHLANDKSLSPDERQYVVHAIWELVIEGVLVPNHVNGENGWPFVSFTEHGKKVISGKKPIPYDPTGYLGQFSTSAHNLDSIAKFYVEEALECFLSNRHTASVLMLGTASERLLDLLLDAFTKSLKSTTEQNNLTKATQNKLLRMRYFELKKRIEPKKSQLLPNLGQALDTYLGGVFEIIRQDRNEAGHPTGRQMSRDEAYAYLLLFPHYCEQMCSLITHLSNNPASLT